MSNIQLSESEKEKLIELTQSHSELLMHRASLILAYADGKPTMQAAMEAGISRGRARYWKRQFLSDGMAIFNLEGEGATPSDQTTKAVIPPSSKSKPVKPIRIKTEDKIVKEGEILYPLPQTSVGLTLDDTLAEAGRKVWLYHFAIMLGHEQGTLLGENIEELHDMRVATRRMRSAFDIFSPAFNPKILKRFQKDLRNIGRVLGQVRDMDVILANGLIYQNKLAEQDRSGLDPLLNSWRQTIENERVKLIKHLHSGTYQNFKQDFNKFLQPPPEDIVSIDHVTDSVSKIRDIIPILVYSRYAALRVYETILPTATITELHELRIEFKKFRYTLEYFKEVMDESVSKLISEIKQYQDHLGELHDADVTCQLIRSFLKTWEENQFHSPIQERINPESIVTYLAYQHSERYRLMITFPELWEKFNRTEFRVILGQSISKL